MKYLSRLQLKQRKIQKNLLQQSNASTEKQGVFSQGSIISPDINIYSCTISMKDSQQASYYINDPNAVI